MQLAVKEINKSIDLIGRKQESPIECVFPFLSRAFSGRHFR
jgi:hypothetical protein